MSSPTVAQEDNLRPWQFGPRALEMESFCLFRGHISSIEKSLIWRQKGSWNLFTWVQNALDGYLIMRYEVHFQKQGRHLDSNIIYPDILRNFSISLAGIIKCSIFAHQGNGNDRPHFSPSSTR